MKEATNLAACALSPRSLDRMRFLFTMSDNPRPSAQLPRICSQEAADRQTVSSSKEDSAVPGSGGARRDRTDDLMLAKHALSQLSYGPFVVCAPSARGPSRQLGGAFAPKRTSGSHEPILTASSGAKRRKADRPPRLTARKPSGRTSAPAPEAQ